MKLTDSPTPGCRRRLGRIEHGEAAPGVHFDRLGMEDFPGVGGWTLDLLALLDDSVATNMRFRTVYGRGAGPTYGRGVTLSNDSFLRGWDPKVPVLL